MCVKKGMHSLKSNEEIPAFKFVYFGYLLILDILML